MSKLPEIHHGIHLLPQIFANELDVFLFLNTPEQMLLIRLWNTLFECGKHLKMCAGRCFLVARHMMTDH